MIRRTAAAFALVIAAACSSTDQAPIVVAPEETTETAPEASGRTPSPSGVAAPGASAPQARRVVTPGRRAKRATVVAPVNPLKIGIVVPTGDPAAVLGASTTPEDYGRIARAVAEEINVTGGIAGRKVTFVVREVDDSNQDQATQTRLHTEACTQVTEDDKAFLVLAFSRGAYYATACYASHRTPVLSYLSAVGRKEFARYSPWIIPPLSLTTTRMAKLMAVDFANRRFLNRTMGLLAYDLPEYRQTAREALIPEIERRGGKFLETVYAPLSYEGLAASASSAVLRFRQAGINRVVLWAPGGGVWLIFARQADAQAYYPRYGISSNDAPVFTQTLMPASQLRGALGPGYWPGSDVHDSQYPVTAREKACWAAVNKRAGTTYRQRDSGAQNGFTALGVCDAFYQTRAALAPARGKALSASSVAGLFGRLGASYRPVQFPKSLFAPGLEDGIASWAPLAFDAGCECFDYRGAYRDLPKL